MIMFMIHNLKNNVFSDNRDWKNRFNYKGLYFWNASILDFLWFPAKKNDEKLLPSGWVRWFNMAVGLAGTWVQLSGGRWGIDSNATSCDILSRSSRGRILALLYLSWFLPKLLPSFPTDSVSWHILLIDSISA